MAGYVRNARIRIVIDGQLRPYTDGHWVVFNKDNFPIGFMLVERKHLVVTLVDGRGIGYKPDPEKAFSDFWSFDAGMTALKAAMQGYRIELVSSERGNELLDKHKGELPKQRPVEELALPQEERSHDQ